MHSTFYLFYPSPRVIQSVLQYELYYQLSEKVVKYLLRGWHPSTHFLQNGGLRIQTPLVTQAEFERA